MQQTQTRKLRSLLEQAGSGHHEFEENELRGVSDEDWPRWYARYLLDHGVCDITGQEISEGDLATLLQECDTAYKRDQAQEEWPDYYARRILASAGDGQDAPPDRGEHPGPYRPKNSA